MGLPEGVTVLSRNEKIVYMLKETENQVSFIKRERLEGASRSGKKWSKFLPKFTLTVKISEVNNRKRVNVFSFTPKSKTSKLLVMKNITNNVRELSSLDWLMDNNLGEFVFAVNKLMRFHGMPEISNVKNLMKVAYPLFENKISNDNLQYISPFYAQIGRCENIEEFYNMFSITSSSLKRKLENDFSFENLFWVATLYKVHSEETVEKIIDVLDEQVDRSKTEKMLNGLQNTPTQYRGLFSKISSEHLIKSVKQKTFSYEGLCWNASAWSKHYRILRKNRAPLLSLETEIVSEYILSYIMPKMALKKSKLLNVNPRNQPEGITKEAWDNVYHSVYNKKMVYRTCKIFRLEGQSDAFNIPGSKLSQFPSTESPYYVATEKLRTVLPGLWAKLEPLLYGQSNNIMFLASPIYVKVFFNTVEQYFMRRFKTDDDYVLNVLFKMVDSLLTDYDSRNSSKVTSYREASFRSVLFPGEGNRIVFKRNDLQTFVSLMKSGIKAPMAAEMILKDSEYAKEYLSNGANVPSELLVDFFELKLNHNDPDLVKIFS